ncbi:DUF488 family protein [Proteiniclasticum sp. SCR006]|uniref:DUF488 family protein n=1 Tax=Proteiniclasticum aestuarii TaxID=2817862 RepID=A0A939KIL1_9CLOT|nr:DUF488 family protein [Proteiniclasticum aestuarii]MBO1264091.1 DUF488 family protein [Proteiniclasticum aestuarii]
MGEILLRRIYEEKKEKETRILVDRLWPRGVSKEKADLDHWAKDITPSDALRQAYHDGKLEKEQFQEHYRKEMAENEAMETFLTYVEDRLKEQDVVLLSSVKELSDSHVPVLKEFLEEKRMKKNGR